MTYQVDTASTANASLTIQIESLSSTNAALTNQIDTMTTTTSETAMIDNQDDQLMEQIGRSVGQALPSFTLFYSLL